MEKVFIFNVEVKVIDTKGLTKDDVYKALLKMEIAYNELYEHRIHLTVK